jgi:hypothetical protein
MAQQDMKAKVVVSASIAMLSLALSLAAVGLSNCTWWAGSFDQAEFNPALPSGFGAPEIQFSITLWERELAIEYIPREFGVSYIPGETRSLSIHDWCNARNRDVAFTFPPSDDEWCSNIKVVRAFVFLEFFAALSALVCTAMACALPEIMPRANTGAIQVTAVVSTGFASLCALIAVSVAGAAPAEVTAMESETRVRLDLSLSGAGSICTILSLVVWCLCCLPGLAMMTVRWWRAAAVESAAVTVSPRGPTAPQPSSQGYSVWDGIARFMKGVKDKGVKDSSPTVAI